MYSENTVRPLSICLTLVAALVLTAVPGCAQDGATSSSQDGAAAADSSEMSEDDKVFYALGMAMSQNLGVFALTAEELAIVTSGLEDSILGNEPKVDIEVYGPKIQGVAQARVAAAAETEKAQGDAFLAEQEDMEGAVKSDSGLIITEIEAGTGASPSATDRVKVHYHGTLRDGTIFDSSVDRGEPVSFGLNQVIGCWTEGLQQMKVGGKSRLVCPASIAYGEQGRPPQIPGNAVLVFEVELLGIEEAEEAG